jgi:RNA polymerase sigma factor (TIGR02999 family)
MAQITEILRAIEKEGPQATAQLLPLVYEELRRLAAGKMAEEPSGQTLQPTALVHEAYLRLLGSGQGAVWDHRGHFFAAAAEAMRRILVDRARRKKAVRRGGDWQRVPLIDGPCLTGADEDCLSIDEALTRFSRIEPAKAELVKLRFFAGLSMNDTANALGISLATAERWWVFARAWLFGELKREVGGPENFGNSENSQNHEGL